MEKKFAIFDLDGCLFDDSHRKHWLSEQGKTADQRWEAYHSYLELDKRIPHAVRRLLQARVNECEIVFITGRPVKYRIQTESMIRELFEIIMKDHGIDSGSWAIVMRPDGDAAASPVLKEKALLDHDLNADNVVVAYDDRADVLDMYAWHGICARLLNKAHKGLNDWVPSKAPPCEKSGDELAGLRNMLGASGQDGAKANIAQAESLAPVADLMDKHAATFRERYDSYGNNAEVVGRLMAAMFPNGVQLNTAKDFEIWHLFELMIVKLSRFSSSGLRHEDSINDLPAYCAMVHRLINDHNITFLKERP